MKIREQLRRDAALLRTMGKQKRRTFIWDYYKLPIIVTVSIATLVVLTLVTNIGRADTVMYVVLINADDTGDPEAFSRLLTEGGVNMAGRRVEVAVGYTLGLNGAEAMDASTVQVLAVLFGIGDLDLFAANEKVFERYAVQDAFVDISLFVEKDILAAHEEDLYRYDNSYGNEIIGGVWLRAGSPLHEAGYYTEDVLIGAASQAEHLDIAVETIKYILAK